MPAPSAAEDLPAGPHRPRRAGVEPCAFEPLEPRRLLSAPAPTPVVCPPYDPLLAGPAVAAAAAGFAADPLVPLEETFTLHSNPSATKTIFLDFDGHVTSGTTWNDEVTGGAEIVSPPYSLDGAPAFSETELARIQRIWQRVAEDYLPFNVDVTTEDPGPADLARSGWGDNRWGVRVVIGGDSADWYGSAAGGVAYIGSFTWSTDTPAFVFSEDLSDGSEKQTAEAASHEAGHTLGLKHDGTSTEEYYSGFGSGPTGWAPIMGAGYYKQLVQWSRGEYPDANNHEDDLAIITADNGFGYRADDHGDGPADADALAVADGAAVADEGIIERNTDVDWFTFTTGAGPVAIEVHPAAVSPDLDVAVTLYDASGSPLASDNPTGRLDAAISLFLAPGTYYLAVEGVGDPAAGYGDYGSLGYYSISGSIVDPASLPRISLAVPDAAAAEAGRDAGRFTITRTGAATAPLEVFFTLGGTAEEGADYRAVGGSVVLPAGRAEAEVVIIPIDDDLPEGEETVTLALRPDAAYLVSSPDPAVVTLADDDLVLSAIDYALAQSTAAGEASGPLDATKVSDDTYQEIEEERTSIWLGRTSMLEHTWTFEVRGGANVTFFIEAWHEANDEGDDFVFDYSTDGVTWAHLLTVTKRADDDTLQSVALPADLGGVVYVRVRDTDRTWFRRHRDSLYIDWMFFRCDPGIVGDADLDGLVGPADYLALKAALGTKAGAMWTQGDFDADGDVDVHDLRALQSAFGHVAARSSGGAGPVAAAAAADAGQTGADRPAAAPAAPIVLPDAPRRRSPWWRRPHRRPLPAGLLPRLVAPLRRAVGRRG